MIDRKNGEPLGGSLSNQPSIQLHDFVATHRPSYPKPVEVCGFDGCYSPRNAGIHVYRKHRYEEQPDSEVLAVIPEAAPLLAAMPPSCRWCVFPENDATFHL